MNTSPQTAGFLVIAGLAGLIGWGLYSWLGPESASERYDRILAERKAVADSLAQQAAETNLRAIAAAQVAVLATLRDPQSAQFTGVVPGSGVPGSAVCGYVNARNGFGGYAGATRFVWVPDKTLVEGRDPPLQFAETWRIRCP